MKIAATAWPEAGDLDVNGMSSIRRSFAALCWGWRIDDLPVPGAPTRRSHRRSPAADGIPHALGHDVTALPCTCFEELGALARIWFCDRAGKHRSGPFLTHQRPQKQNGMVAKGVVHSLLVCELVNKVTFANSVLPCRRINGIAVVLGKSCR